MPWSPLHRYVLGTVGGNGQLVVRDVTDINNGKTLCTLPPASFMFGAHSARFAGAGKAIYPVSTDNRFYLERVDLATGAVTDVPISAPWQSGASSPDGLSFAYLKASGDCVCVHLLQQGHDTTIATYPPIPAADWFNENPAFEVAFSGDGSLIAIENVFAGGQPVLQVRRLDGALPYSALSNPNAGVWSGDLLYFNYPGDPQVYRWAGAARGEAAFVAKGPWLAPSAGTGGKLAYHWRDTAGLAHVAVVDASGTTIATVPVPYRAGPVFIGDSILWYHGEKACGDACGPLPEPDGNGYVFDISTGAEFPSVLTTVNDVWPRLDTLP